MTIRRLAAWGTSHPQPPIPLRLVILICAALAAWVILWSSIMPRAGYDTLWYEMFGLRYAGASDAEQIAGSWEVFAENADPAVVARIDAADGWPWKGWEDPTRARWIGLYQMRPVFPLIVAATRPIVGEASALAPSLVAVVVFTVGVGLGAWTLIGPGATALILLISFINPLSSQWLIHLTTDGLGLALWATSLVAAARFVSGGSRSWLLALFASTLVAAFTRQTGIVLVLSLGSLSLVALLARRPIWRRLALATAATTLPLVVFSLYGALAGLPSLADMLQDTPTRHYADPDIANLPRYVVAKAVEQLPILASRLFEDPRLWIPLMLAILGLAVTRTWWAALLIISLAFLPVLHVAHPILTEANRTLSPGWFNVHVGLVLLVVAGWSRLRQPHASVLRPSA